MKTTLISFLLSAILSCGNGGSTDKKANGITEDAILAKYGSPKRESVIKLTKGMSLHEYQSNLYNLYPNLSSADTVEIRELFWEYQNGDKMVIWLDKKDTGWIEVDNLKWSKDVKFYPPPVHADVPSVCSKGCFIKEGLQ